MAEKDDTNVSTSSNEKSTTPSTEPVLETARVNADDRKSPHSRQALLRLSKWELVCLSVGLMLTVFTIAFDSYILANAIPHIAAHFSSLNYVGWYSSSYFITLVAFQPAFAHLLENFPFRRTFLASNVIFMAGCVLCATAPSSLAFIFGRLITGIGAGGMFISVLTTVARTIPLQRRPLYFSLVTSMFGIGSIVGPVVGGIFTDSARLTWRFCFWVGIPIAAVASTLVVIPLHGKQFPATRATERKWKDELIKLDVPGLLVLLAALTCYTLTFERAGLQAWSRPSVWGCLLAFVLLSGFWFVIQFSMKDRASVPIKLMTQRTVASASLFIAFINGVVGVLGFYLPLFFQLVQGLSARTSGIHCLPALVSMLVSPIVSGTIINIWGHYITFMMVGPLISVVGSSLMYTMNATTPYSRIAGFQVLTGFGLALSTQIPYTAVQAVLPPEHTVLGTALISFCNILGPVLSINVAQAIFQNVFVDSAKADLGPDAGRIFIESANNLQRRPSPEVRGYLGDSIRWVFILMAISSSLGFLCSFGVERVNLRKKARDEASPTA